MIFKITKASDPQQLGHKAARRSMWGDLWRYRSKLQSANPREDVSSELLALRLFRTIRQFEQLTVRRYTHTRNPNLFSFIRKNQKQSES